VRANEDERLEAPIINLDKLHQFHQHSTNMNTAITTVADLPMPPEDVIAQRAKQILKIVDSVLTDQSPRTRARIAIAIESIASGSPWSQAVSGARLRWPVIQSLKRRPVFRELWQAAENAGEDTRARIRLELAHKHATNGTKKAVYHNGLVVGHITEWDHRLLEFLIKADNPDKFRDKHQQNAGNSGVQVMVQWNFGERPTEPKRVDADITPHDAANTP